MKQPTVIIALLFATVFNYVKAQNAPLATQIIDADPKLEIIEARQAKVVDTSPLLFVHGYRMGSWIFEDNYLPFFYDKGYDVFAVNLRGHGWSEGAEQIENATLEEYYADLENAVAYIESETGETPLLIGFSMGAESN